MYTDGVTEARSPGGELFGMDRTLDVVTRSAPSAEGVLDAVNEAIQQHAGGREQSDDITMLMLRRSSAA
jgi:serine phosphatase RsbU (regulator of sigma subunit)